MTQPQSTLKDSVESLQSSLSLSLSLLLSPSLTDLFRRIPQPAKLELCCCVELENLFALLFLLRWSCLSTQSTPRIRVSATCELSSCHLTYFN